LFDQGWAGCLEHEIIREEGMGHTRSTHCQH
jgi:hypothetical protein